MHNYDLNRQFRDALENGDLALLEKLVGQGVDVNDISYGTPAANIVAARGYFGCLQYLVEQGANFHGKSDDKWTALHSAIQNGYLDCAKYLIGKGADIRAKTGSGYTVLHCSAMHGHLDCIQYLMEQGVNTQAKNKSGKTAMDVAIEKNELDAAGLIQDLINARAENKALESIIQASSDNVSAISF